MELVEHLMSQLGVSPDQAKGGAGLLLKMAKEHLGGDFEQIAAAIPGTNDMINAAPDAEGSFMGAIGGMAAKFGIGDNLGDITALAAGFDELGLDADMIAKFIPTILDFVEQHAGPQIKQILEGLLKPQ
ncbi:MAG: DUF2780 domain-containing protein [Planctomycetaceae bacterium]|nr:DUF2780 domain-containing protein [Planctomycetaceae bacterium]